MTCFEVVAGKVGQESQVVIWTTTILYTRLVIVHILVDKNLRAQEVIASKPNTLTGIAHQFVK